MDKERTSAPAARIAALEHLTGPSRGSVTWLHAPALDISLSPERFVHVSEALPPESSDDLVGRLQRVDDTYEVEAPGDEPLWVNGIRVTARRLEHRDMIEFGETGALSRFCLHPDEERPRKTVEGILRDGLAYLRASRQPPARRVYRTVMGLLRRLAFETTILFRGAVLVAILVLAGLAWQQDRWNEQLREQIESGAARLDSYAGALARAREEEALTPSDLNDLREELGRRLTSAAERLEALEQRSRASGRVIAESMSAVAFIQGAYGFRDGSSGRMLRYVTGADGRPLLTPRARTPLTLDGDGPVAERQFTGTGFIVGEAGVLVTNRHVALPWEQDTSDEALAGQGLEPVMVRFIVYLPGKAEPTEVELLRASDEADLAILTLRDEDGTIPSLRISDSLPAAGDEVIVMGYPTGLRAMLAQSGTAFIEALQETGETGFWSVAAHLAEEGYIAPLASRGIVGQATPSTIVYDADTTHGGSGGPVLDIDGAVVAVNAAILPEYGGSNLGVPADKLRALLEAAGLR